MPVPAWWTNLTWRIPVVRTYRMAVQNAKQPKYSDSSYVVGGLPDGAEYQATFTYEDQPGHVFMSRDSFEHFIVAVQAQIPEIPINFGNDKGDFKGQLDRYFSSVLQQRRILTLTAVSEDQKTRLTIISNAEYGASPMSTAKTYVEVSVRSNESGHAQRIGNEINIAFMKFADSRPLRGRASRAAVIHPMDVHSRELEHFKSRQNRRTVWISASISIGVAVLTIGSRIIWT